jgi:hypothetical protein
MKCAKCTAEVPGQAQFCMKCGTPVSAGRPNSTVTMSRPLATASPTSRPKTGLILGVIAAVAVVVLTAYFGVRNMTNRNGTAIGNGRLTEGIGRPLNGGGLVDRDGKIHDTGPLTDRNAVATPGPADPVEIIDYLKHLREIERQRVALAKAQLAQLLTLSADIQGKTLVHEMGDHPEEGHQKDYNNFQEKLSQWSSQWEDLSRKFNGYPKPVPQSCITLRDRYLDALGKTSAAMSTVGSSFAKAMGSDPGGAIDALTKMQGDRSIDDSCDKADAELATVCDKYHLHKDFDIKADGGASNPFGVGR